MYGYRNGRKVFSIPVEWIVTETLDIRADSLKEAVHFIIDKLDEIPLGTEPTYIDGTYKISSDGDDCYDEESIIEYLNNARSYSEREASDMFDTVEDL